MSLVFIVHRYSEPRAAFSSKEKAALWIYEQHQITGWENMDQITEFIVDACLSTAAVKPEENEHE